MKGRPWLIATLVGVLLIGGAVVFNGLVSLDEQASEAWHNIEAQLRRRADLIPNLVNTVQGYAAHESAIFEELAAARAARAQAATVAEKAAVDAQITAALGRLMAVVGSTPELKADVNFRQLQDALEGTENRISVARERYNEAVAWYNGSLCQFPGVLLAQSFGFTPREYFSLSPDADGVPQVDFGGGS